MGWTFPWVSSHDSDFNYDFGVSFTPEDLAAGRAIYNYGTRDPQQLRYVRRAASSSRTRAATSSTRYSTYHRGTELLMGAFNWLDLAPKGRNEAAAP